METLDRVKYRVEYDGTDITEDISRHVLGITYKDYQENESDTLDISLEDSARKWIGPWYPDKGSKLSLELGRQEMILLGVFDIDEITFSGPPNRVKLCSQATGVSSASRTSKNAAYENQALSDIAQKVATANGWTLQGDIQDINFRRRTQFQETDLAFLNRLCKETGHTMAVRNDQLYITNIYELESADEAGVLDITDVAKFSFSGKITGAGHKSATSEFYDTEQGQVHRVAVTSGDALADAESSEDEIICRERVESTDHAEAKARSEVYRSAREQQTGTISGIKGQPFLLAGNKIALTGFGEMSGFYQIASSTHTVTRSQGWTVSLEVKRIQLAIAEMKDPKTLRRKSYVEVSQVPAG